eukprot:2334742-Prymnesium_polylepis.1
MDSFLAKGPAAQPPSFETESEASDVASQHALSRESMPDIQAEAELPQSPTPQPQPSPPPSPQPPPPPPQPQPAPASTSVDLAVQDAPVGEDEVAPVQETRSLFAPYLGFLPGPAHPSDLFTSSTLLLAMKSSPPDVALVHEELMLEDKLSSPQLDAVALSAARVQDGKALLIGCATGTGKGRMLCASAWNHTLFHKKTHVLYLTVSSALAADVRRDVAAIGWNVDVH